MLASKTGMVYLVGNAARFTTKTIVMVKQVAAIKKNKLLYFIFLNGLECFTVSLLNTWL